MPLIRIKADILDFDSRSYGKILNEFMMKEFREGVRAFLRAAVVRIPVDTGMARGSFLHIGRLLKVAIPIKPKKSRTVTLKNGKTYVIKNKGQLYYHPPAYGYAKIPETGAELTTPAEEVLLQDGNTTIFRLQSKVFHLTLNDLLGTKGTGPWQAFEAGRHAMLSRLETMSERFPSIKKAILRSRLSVGRGGVSSEAFKPLVRRKTIGE